MLHSEMLPVSGATFDALDRERLQDYLLALAGDRGLPATDEAWQRRMVGLGFMTETGVPTPVCTIAGLVLFGRTPRRCLRQAGVRWMAFNGPAKSYQALDVRYSMVLWLAVSDGGTTPASLLSVA